MVLQVLDGSFLNDTGLDGFIHLWGAAGSGKTIFASLIAAEASRYGLVEWINTDSKKVFIRNLKANVNLVGGVMENINVTVVESHQEARQIISTLPELLEENTVLCVVDTMTRTLDFARNNPVLWGQEFLEVVLPILSSLSRKRGFRVVATSECRQLPEYGVVPVLHRAISKWADHEILVKRSAAKPHSYILLSGFASEDEILLATIRPHSNGSLELIKTEAAVANREV